MIIDGFLGTFHALRQWGDQCAFSDQENPIDGVVYPNICTDIPIQPASEILVLLSGYLKRPIKDAFMFVRMSPEGVKAPHQAHNDISMGQHSLMLYMNRPKHCQGGTSLVRHIETGIDRTPETQEQADVLIADANDYDKWKVVETAEMQPNRAFIFDAGLMHRAEPVEGFGTNQRDSRMVLTVFFS